MQIAKTTDKKVAVFGYHDDGNLGDEIYLQILHDNNYNIKFSSMLKGTHSLKTKTIDHLPQKLRKKFREPLHRLITHLGVHTVDYSALRDFDSTLLGPGGLIWLSDVFFFTVRCDDLYSALKKINCPVFSYGLGVDLVSKELDKTTLEMWAQLLSLCDTVHVRDNSSKNLLLANSIHDRVEVVNDIAFAYPLPESIKLTKKAVGINLRNEVLDELDPVLNLINYFIKLGYDVLLISCQEGRKESDNDTRILEKIAKIAPHRDSIRIIRSSSPDNILRHIGSVDFFIGMRYHSILFALRYGIPTCAIAYRPKVKALMEEYYGLGEYVVAPRDVPRIKELFMDREKIRTAAVSKTAENEANTSRQLETFLRKISESSSS